MEPLWAGFWVGEELFFDGDEGVADGLGIGRGEELVDDFRFLRDKAEPGQCMQVQPVILAANQEEQTRWFTVGRAEMDFLNRPSDDKK